MCGRYLVEDEVYADLWATLSQGSQAPLPATGEIYPSTMAPVILSGGAASLIWGFPHWKRTGIIINARSETAREKSMFQKPLLEGRCVVPSSGFYEWDRNSGGKKKNKYLLREPGATVLYMAGISAAFRGPSGEEYRAFAILTTSASESVSRIHDRMPVILARDEADPWLADFAFARYALRRAGPELEAAMCR